MEVEDRVRPRLRDPTVSGRHDPPVQLRRYGNRGVVLRHWVERRRPDPKERHVSTVPPRDRGREPCGHLDPQVGTGVGEPRDSLGVIVEVEAEALHATKRGDEVPRPAGERERNGEPAIGLLGDRVDELDELPVPRVGVEWLPPPRVDYVPGIVSFCPGRGHRRDASTLDRVPDRAAEHPLEPRDRRWRHRRPKELVVEWAARIELRRVLWTEVCDVQICWVEHPLAAIESPVEMRRRDAPPARATYERTSRGAPAPERCVLRDRLVDDTSVPRRLRIIRPAGHRSGLPSAASTGSSGASSFGATAMSR